ncbi:hypothetical protein Ate01nite_68640 [Actinoplanes teichomyceticus]|nr:hypothetical protein Ate01nite_68640 [Actinoplanes teichomyceticus]
MGGGPHCGCGATGCAEIGCVATGCCGPGATGCCGAGGCIIGGAGGNGPLTGVACGDVAHGPGGGGGTGPGVMGSSPVGFREGSSLTDGRLPARASGIDGVPGSLIRQLGEHGQRGSGADLVEQGALRGPGHPDAPV